MEKKLNTSTKRRYGRFITNLLSVPLLLLLAFGAIKAGVVMGNLASDMESGFIGEIYVGNFKMMLNKSIHLMETVYNSGRIDVSFASEFNKLLNYIFDFNLNTPLTILNAQSPFFNSYYYNHYLPQIAHRDTGSKHENGSGELHEGAGGNNETENGNNTENGDKAEEPLTEYPEVVSSITFEGDPEEKDPSKSDVVSSGRIVVQNQTKFKIDEAEINRLLKEPLKINFKEKGPKVLVLHTHTTEAYIKSLSDLNKKNVPNWSRDPRQNVVSVGDELAQTLEKKFGVSVLHNGTVHDYQYNSSYSNALRTINQYLKSHPSIRLIFDIHRDGLKAGESKLRLTTKINGRDVARVMFVVGTNGTGLEHPEWKENLKLAIKLQEKLNEKYPGLARNIYISENRYNQHMSKGSLIIEIGGDGNLLSECIESARYVAYAINEVMK